MQLTEIAVGQRLIGLTGDLPVEVIAATAHGTEALTLVYQDQFGVPGSRVITAYDAGQLEIAIGATRPFDASAGDFKLAAEAQRIRLAGLHDPMAAVSTSDVRPLPHQLDAVYNQLLDRPQLRFLLADDPGAGKTIMAALYIKEMMLRGLVERCLIVAPGGLVDQWRDELFLKFGLQFEVLTNGLRAGSSPGSVFDRYPRLIARMDQLARNEELLEELQESRWDLVIVDEAHRMGAHWYGSKLSKTRRFELGEHLGAIADHYLLMTATPHSGNEADFQLFLTLLDRDQFAGRYRSGIHSVDLSGVMRRMVKEELLTFEGTPLFPERIAQSAPYQLSSLERRLYDEVSAYVRDGMNRADRLDGKRRNTIGFALTVLQRRLASSPEAILMSLRRRVQRLARHKDDLENGIGVATLTGNLDLYDDEEFTADEREELETELVDASTAATTVAELDIELAMLADLIALAERVRRAGTDRKWNELRSILEGEVLNPDGDRRRKLIIFTEHRDTLDYLTERIRALLGTDNAVEVIHGGVSRVERRRITEEFTRNPDCQILVATDAAGEGLNLQAAHLMVNYDLPWNPNRIEQRFGRVHRIGQKEVCRLWNLFAADTREGDVFERLLLKVEEQRRAYGGKVFDVLGEAFAERPLRELLLEAIRYGDQPEVRAHMDRVIDERVAEGLPELIAERALAQEVVPTERVEEMRRQIAEARARRLQPYYLEQFFVAAFPRLGGRFARRESGRLELTNVPNRLRPRSAPIASRYERVTFRLDRIEVDGAPDAELLAPGQPLHDTVVREATAEWGQALDRGTVLVADGLPNPRLLVGLQHEVRDGMDARVAARFDHVWVDPDGTCFPAGPAPYLDCDPLDDPAAAREARQLPWLADAEREAVSWQIGHELPEFLDTFRRRRLDELSRTRTQVTERMRLEINRLGADALVADQPLPADPLRPSSLDHPVHKASELERRLAERLADLDRQSIVRSVPPRVASVALVLPRPAYDDAPPDFAVETKEVERRGVDAVLAAEQALGREPTEMPFNNKGFDILSRAPSGEMLTIEVKARRRGGSHFLATQSEVLAGKNSQPDYRLAIVVVDPRGPAYDEVRYVDDPFAGTELGLQVTHIWLDLNGMWAQGTDPH